MSFFKNLLLKLNLKKKKTRKQHTHVIFSDEVDILSYAENCIQISNLFFKSSGYSHFHKQDIYTLQGGEVLGKLCA